MQLSEKGEDFLCKLEAFSPVPYLDSGVAPTIGYGHLILLGQTWDEPLTKDEGRWILLGDAAYAEYSINHLVLSLLTQYQYDALLCLVFNIGTRAFANSTILRLLNQKKFDLAAKQFDVWIYDNGKRVQGLANRRAREKALFKSGLYET